MLAARDEPTSPVIGGSWDEAADQPHPPNDTSLPSPSRPAVGPHSPHPDHMGDFGQGAARAPRRAGRAARVSLSRRANGGIIGNTRC